jgi:transcriptional regulator with XRE-family HTH domain
MDIRAQLGETVRKLRLARGLSLEELAFRAGMDYTYVSGIERGLRNPSLAVLIDLSRALEVHPADLLRTLDISSSANSVPRKRAGSK